MNFKNVSQSEVDRAISRLDIKPGDSIVVMTRRTKGGTTFYRLFHIGTVSTGNPYLYDITYNVAIIQRLSVFEANEIKVKPFYFDANKIVNKLSFALFGFGNLLKYQVIER